MTSLPRPARATRCELAREAYEQGYRRFIAVGGDGTAHEILNGVYASARGKERIALGFLPLGTGNSFLRDFAKDGAEASLQALLEGRKRPVDLVRLTHASGEIYSFNLLSIGFTADVGALTNRYFKPLGHLGYLLGVFVRVVQLRRRAFRCVATTIKIGTRAAAYFLPSTTANTRAARCSSRPTPIPPTD